MTFPGFRSGKLICVVPICHGYNWLARDLRGSAFTHRVGGVHGFQFRGDGELLIMSFSEGSMGLWRAHTGELLQRLKIVPHTFHPSALSRDCRCIAQLASNHQIAPVDVAGDRVLHTLTGSTSPIWQITFSPNGQFVASGHVGGQVCVWEVASGRCCAEWRKPMPNRSPRWHGQPTICASPLVRSTTAP